MHSSARERSSSVASKRAGAILRACRCGPCGSWMQRKTAHASHCSNEGGSEGFDPFTSSPPSSGRSPQWIFKDVLGYDVILKDMKTYLRNSLEIQDILWHHILKRISQTDIPGYPCISKGFPKKISHYDILQFYSQLSKLSYSKIPMISNHISKKDLQSISFQSWNIHLISNKDILQLSK